MKRFTFLVLAVVAAGTACVALSGNDSAQPKAAVAKVVPENAPHVPIARAHHPNTQMEELSNASLRVTRKIDGKEFVAREIRYKRTEKPGVYAQTPLFFPVELSKSFGDLPPIFKTMTEQSDGSVALTVWLKLFDDAFVPDGIQAVRLADEAHAVNNPSADAGIRIVPWSIIDIVLVCKNSVSNEVLAVTKSDSLGSMSHDCLLPLHFTKSGFERLKEGLKQDQIVLVPHYTYAGTEVAQGRRDSRGDVATEAIVKDALNSAGADSTTIFLTQKDAITTYVTVRWSTRIRGDLTVLPLLSPTTVAARLFTDGVMQRLKLDDLTGSNLELLGHVAKVLDPRIRNIIESEAQSNADIKIGDREISNIKENQKGISLVVLYAENQADVTKVLDRIKKETGVIYQKVANTSEYAPYSVETFALRNGYEKQSLFDDLEIIVPVKSELGYFVDSPIPLTMTLREAKEGIKAGAPQAMVSPASPGDIKLTVSNHVAPGWVPWVPGNLWPMESWVPRHLQGRDMGNPDRMALLAALDSADVGTIISGQTFAVQGSVEGKSFQTPDSTAVQFSAFDPAIADKPLGTLVYSDKDRRSSLLGPISSPLFQAQAGYGSSGVGVHFDGRPNHGFIGGMLLHSMDVAHYWENGWVTVRHDTPAPQKVVPQAKAVQQLTGNVIKGTASVTSSVKMTDADKIPGIRLRVLVYMPGVTPNVR